MPLISDIRRKAKDLLDDLLPRVSVPIEHHFNRLDHIELGAYVLMSESKLVDTAVIFVHGFLGDPEGTWLNFQGMIDSHQRDFPKWGICDAYFFPYPSFGNSISESAERLLRFAKVVFPKPPSEIFDIPTMVRNYVQTLSTLSLKRHRYKHLVFVGHSEGCIVIRRAMCLAYKRTEGGDKLLRAQLALFAPAHLGFVPSGWIGMCLAIGRIASIAMPILSSSPAFVEMKDKTLLGQIKEDTSAFYGRSPHLSGLRARVLFGSNEHVVMRGEYTHDFPEPPEPGEDHVSICKPRTSFTRPLQFALKSRE